MLPQIRREPSLLLRRALEEGQKENLGVAASENESLRRTLGHRSASCSASPSGSTASTRWITNFVPPYLVSPRIYFFFSQLEKVAFTRPQKRLARFRARYYKPKAQTEQKRCVRSPDMR